MSLEIDLETMNERVGKCTWRPSSTEIGVVLGCDQCGGSSSEGKRDGC